MAPMAIDAEEILAAAHGALSLDARLPRNELQREIYLQVYAGSFRGGSSPKFVATAPVDFEFVAAARRRMDRKTVLPCKVLSYEPGVAEVEIDGIRARAATSDVVESADGAGVVVAALTLGGAPGFLSLVSRHGLPEGLLSRFYFNVDSQGALELMDELVIQLEERGHRFSIKALANPVSYFRRDSVVLYVSTSEASPVMDLCSDWLQGERLRLDAGTPLLTDEVVPGLGFADDPEQRMYGGPSRTTHGTLVTSWLTEAVSSSDNPDDCVVRINACIRRGGREITAPHRRGADGAAALN